jgi:hypothetical protein
MRRRRFRGPIATLLLAIAATSCRQGGAPSNLLVSVANERTEQATFSWLSPGLFGMPLFRSTETEPLGGCFVYVRGFGPGHQQVTIKLASQTLSLAFDVGADDPQQAFVVIGVDESIRQVAEDQFPQGNPCAPSPS